MIFGRPKLPPERRHSDNLAAYKDSDLAWLKRVNPELFDYLESLSDKGWAPARSRKHSSME